MRFQDFLDEEERSEISPAGPDPEPFAEAGPMISPEEAAASLGATNRRPLSTAPDMTPSDLPRVTRLPPVVAKTETPDKHTPGLAFMAAFSHNPVLAQLLQDEVQAPERREAKARALALQQEDLGRKRSKESREQAEFDAKAPFFADMARAGIGSKSAYADLMKQKAVQARDEGDPSSDTSKGATSSAAQSLLAQAELVRPKNAVLAEQLAKAAQAMTGKSARSAREILGTLSKIAPQVMKSVNDDFDNWISRRAADRGDRSLDETQRHNEATEGQADAKMTHMLNKPQEHLSSQINDLDQALSNMKEIADLKKDVNTGVYVQSIADFTNRWIDSGLTSDKRKQLSSLLARVFNKETKTLAGAAVSAQEWARISPQIPQDKDDDELFASKLAKAMQITNEILQKRREEYQQKGGAPIDQSVTARKNVRAANNRGELPVPDAKKPSGDPKVDAAKAWLQANPNDPKAAAVRDRLRAMGAL